MNNLKLILIQLMLVIASVSCLSAQADNHGRESLRGSTPKNRQDKHIKLINFTAVKHQDKVQLKWNTTTDTLVCKFKIEKSFDGVTWRNITEKTFNGEANYYFGEQSFENLYEAQLFYKISLINNEGLVYQSTEIEATNEVQVVRGNIGIRNNRIFITNQDYLTNSDYKVQISDIKGRTLTVLPANQISDNFQLNHNNLYIVSVLYNNQLMETKKILIME